MINTEALKNSVGKRAYDRIVSDLGLKTRGAKVQCPSPSHADNNPSAMFYDEGYMFHCYACGTGYDILDHYQINYGLSFAESIDAICRDFNIDKNSLPEESSFIPINKLKKTVKTGEYFKKTVNEIIPTIDAGDAYMIKHGINPEVARNNFYVVTSNTEIFFHHYEIINNFWSVVFSKRRKLNETNYVNYETGAESKELSISDGQSVMYGLTSLYNQNGELKKYTIITEGMKSVLHIASKLNEIDQLDNFAVLSPSNGAMSLNSSWCNSPFFRWWYKEVNPQIILIPDADRAGLDMVEQARDIFDDNNLLWVDLTKITGFKYQETKGLDVDDALIKFNKTIVDVLKLREKLPVKGISFASDVDIIDEKSFLKSGYLTHDYNDGGLKKGRVTIITGHRGSGKTTLSKCFIDAVATTGSSSFCYLGETRESDAVKEFAKLSALDGELIRKINEVGKTTYTPSMDAIDRFRNNNGKKIALLCFDEIEKERLQGNIPNMFDFVLEKARFMAKNRGCKLFLFDNMLTLTGGAKNEFEEQSRISNELKSFAQYYGVHVILVAHPKFGKLAGEQVKVSGSASIENLADTILSVVRIGRSESSKKSLATIAKAVGFPDEKLSEVSAIVENTKVRDNGSDYEMFMCWDDARSCAVDLTYLRDAQEASYEYEANGLYSKSAHKGKYMSYVEEMEENYRKEQEKV